MVRAFDSSVFDAVVFETEPPEVKGGGGDEWADDWTEEFYMKVRGGTAFYHEFLVLNSTGGKVTGLSNVDFIKRLTKNGANSGLTVTVEEVDSVNQPGLYRVTFTPTAVTGTTVDDYHLTLELTRNNFLYGKLDSLNEIEIFMSNTRFG